MAAIHLRNLKTNQNDEQLFARVQKGDQTAFEKIYRKYSSRILHYIIRVSGTHSSQAQDILQDVFLKVIEKRRFFMEQTNFSAWIFTIAHNCCLNELRRTGIRNEIVFNEYEEYNNGTSGETNPPLMESIDRDDFNKRLMRLLSEYDPDQRGAFILRFQENMSIREIAGIQNCPEGTVKSRLHYMLKKLAGQLKEYNPSISEVR